MTGYPRDQLFAEVAFVAYHFGWDHETVLNMPHWERRRWCEEISRLNERMNEGGEQTTGGSEDLLGGSEDLLGGRD